MPTSVRLDAQTESRIRRLARQTGQTTSQVIREAIAVYSARREATPTPGESAYDRLKHVIGVVDSGGARLSENTGEKLAAILREKARARRPR